jgi:hypothetical protein
MFVYNGTTPDPDCANEFGFGSMPVSHGVKVLNNFISSFCYFTNGSTFAQSDPGNGPGCGQYRLFLEGNWLDGTPFTNGGTGYGGTVPVKFVFPGDPTDTTGWSEMTVQNTLVAGDRRFEGSIGPTTFGRGETKRFDFAFLTSYDTTLTSNYFKIVDTLKRDADIIQAFYDNNVLSCRAQQIASGVNEVSNDLLTVSVFPNPATGLLTVEAGGNIQSIELTDMEGRRVMYKALESRHSTLDVSSLARGVYLLKVKSGEKFAVKKVVLQ